MTPETNNTWHSSRQGAALFLRGATVRTAIPTAVVVGTVLSIVNQGTVIADGSAEATTWARVIINYLVPFLVSSVGWLSARRASADGEGPDGGLRR